MLERIGWVGRGILILHGHYDSKTNKLHVLTKLFSSVKLGMSFATKFMDFDSIIVPFSTAIFINTPLFWWEYVFIYKEAYDYNQVLRKHPILSLI